jgi:23S rRNA (cytidine2498-2'-O)-methyltransferase
MKTRSETTWLLYCRPGYEQDCASEALRLARQQRLITLEQELPVPGSGYVTVALGDQRLTYHDLIFARQLIRLQYTINNLSERDRITPIVNMVAELPIRHGTAWIECPDSDAGKQLAPFVRRFSPLLEEALRQRECLQDDPALPRLHVFFPDKSKVLIGSSDPENSSNAVMGIIRQHMPAEAPSRSTLKLAEAFEVLMSNEERKRLLRPGMHAVDLGAAPGGWTWQMVKRGMRVTAIDNGAMKGVLAGHHMVQHLRQDGFKFMPQRSVDWLICDMVEQPSKVARLVANWFVQGWCRHAIFNLKLPMKQRLAAVDSALGGIRSMLDEEGINYRLRAKQLYHDRDEVTVFIARTKR